MLKYSCEQTKTIKSHLNRSCTAADFYSTTGLESSVVNILKKYFPYRGNIFDSPPIFSNISTPCLFLFNIK